MLYLIELLFCFFLNLARYCVGCFFQILQTMLLFLSSFANSFSQFWQQFRSLSNTCNNFTKYVIQYCLNKIEKNVQLDTVTLFLRVIRSCRYIDYQYGPRVLHQKSKVLKNIMKPYTHF